MLTLVVINLAGIGLYLGVGPESTEGAGYRVIDIKAVHRLLDSGDLNLHEADWYQRKTPAQKANN
jgi:hypothetical protein